MFGYVIANFEKLSEEEKQRYQTSYCSLCKSLGNRHKTISRITLTYDMTFLILILSALYPADHECKTERCLIHPLKPHTYWQDEITDYAADMNVTLAYYNFLDDWEDEKKQTALWKAKLFESENRQVAELYPRQCTVIQEGLRELSAIEKADILNPDVPANCFGRLMAEVFILREDEYSPDLRAFGKALGKFIYIMDACLDLVQDIKNERYNPLIASTWENTGEILNLLMADCTEKYKRLPIQQDKNLIENILYSGVWTRYEIANQKIKEKQKQ